MGRRRSVLLTGATGLLGRYLLRNLLRSGASVAVLARDGRSGSAAERVAELVSSWGRLPRPVVLVGDLREPHLGLDAGDRAWLASHCYRALHAAAHVGLLPTADGEPWRTNVEGTRHLLRLCAELGIDELHHVSTAFVCGRRSGMIREDELGQQFHNDYERSKCEAERLVRQALGACATIYRPSVIVGDSRTGYTSTYHGPYRFLDLANRLARPDGSGKRRLELRLPFSGDEPRNLVPVDWVAEAITRIVAEPALHGRTYHLVARAPVLAREIKEVGVELLGLDGVSWAGRAGPACPTPLEEQFCAQLEEYWPYADGDPNFDFTHTTAALPDLPSPTVDRALLDRLIRFAIADNWGRRRRAAGSRHAGAAHHRPAVNDGPTPLKPGEPGWEGATAFSRVYPASAGVGPSLQGGPATPRRAHAAPLAPRTAPFCAAYVEGFFPAAARRSPLAHAGLDVTVGIEVAGPSGGRWACRWEKGALVQIERDWLAPVEVNYLLSEETFAAVVSGRLSVQEAFFAREIEIEGHVEKGLKLAALFSAFVREQPYPSPEVAEAEDARLPV
jgi:thioester reductase-like protein